MCPGRRRGACMTIKLSRGKFRLHTHECGSDFGHISLDAGVRIQNLAREKHLGFLDSTPYVDFLHARKRSASHGTLGDRVTSQDELARTGLRVSQNKWKGLFLQTLCIRHFPPKEWPPELLHDLTWITPINRTDGVRSGGVVRTQIAIQAPTDHAKEILWFPEKKEWRPNAL